MTRDFRSEFRDAIRGQSRNTLKLGELAHELSLEPDSDYNQLRQLLISEDGLDAPDESTVSRYRRVWKYWRVQAGIPSEELEARGVSKLYLLATHISEHGGDPREWLEATKGLSKRELEKSLKGETVESENWPWAQSKEIREEFEVGARRLYEAVAYEAHSLTPAFELAAEAFKRLPVESLRQLWAEAHGEETQ
jgi:hypothetical protein